MPLSRDINDQEKAMCSNSLKSKIRGTKPAATWHQMRVKDCKKKYASRQKQLES
jgi:hypothetical protein